MTEEGIYEMEERQREEEYMRQQAEHESYWEEIEQAKQFLEGVGFTVIEPRTPTVTDKETVTTSCTEKPENLCVSEEHAQVRKLVDEQAEDEGLWFIAQTAAEAYLQQELRKLHAAIELSIHRTGDK